MGFAFFNLLILETAVEFNSSNVNYGNQIWCFLTRFLALAFAVQFSRLRNSKFFVSGRVPNVPITRLRTAATGWISRV